MTETGSIVLHHKLESVKILPPPPLENSPPDYGRVMQDGVADGAHQIPPEEPRALHGGDCKRPRHGIADSFGPGVDDDFAA